MKGQFPLIKYIFPKKDKLSCLSDLDNVNLLKAKYHPHCSLVYLSERKEHSCN